MVHVLWGYGHSQETDIDLGSPPEGLYTGFAHRFKNATERSDERDRNSPGWPASLGDVNSRPRYRRRSTHKEICELATLNVDIPRFYCLLRKEFLYDGTAHHGEFVKVCVFGVASVYGRALGFHVLTENGAVIWRLPIHSLCHREDATDRPLDWLQFWDCFGYEVTCTAFDRLANCRVRVRLRDGSAEGGQYMFTLDWYGTEDSEEAGDGGHKCAHVIALDDGNFAAQPNNRVRWYCPAFVTPWKEKPDYLTNTSVWKVERETETSSGFFYDDVDRAAMPSQVRLYAKGLRVEPSHASEPATGPDSNGTSSPPVR